MISFYRKISLVLICAFLLLLGGGAAFAQESEDGAVKEVRDALRVMHNDLSKGKSIYGYLCRRSQECYFQTYVSGLKSRGQWGPMMAELKAKGISESQALVLLREVLDEGIINQTSTQKKMSEQEHLNNIKMVEKCQIQVKGNQAFIVYPSGGQTVMVKEDGKWKLVLY